MRRQSWFVLAVAALFGVSLAAEASAQTQTRSVSVVSPLGARIFVPNEVVIEVNGTPSPAEVDALARRHSLTRIESQYYRLTNSTMFRWRIPAGRSVEEVVRLLSGDTNIKSVQPNYVFRIQQAAQSVISKGDPAQYTLAKLRIPQAHTVTKGDNVLVAVIDSGIDVTHPELNGVIAGTFAAFDPMEKPHSHGTAIAGAIAAQARLRLMGCAPAVRILAIKAFREADFGAEGTSFNIFKGLEYAVAQGAQVINMSFAGPRDPLLERSIAAAHERGIVLVAAVGNAGPNSAPLYPAADPRVIAVTATDATDKLFAAAVRGNHVAVAAPGVDIALLAPGGSFQFASGTSFAAAHVTAVIALLLERNARLTPGAVRQLLLSTARPLAAKGRDELFGSGLVDAFQALSALQRTRSIQRDDALVAAGR
jgi:hypothetical protein